MSAHTVIIYYKYVPLERPRDTMIAQRALCIELGLKGRILIAHEGINGTLEGPAENIQKYLEYMHQHPLFMDINFKQTPGIGDAFPKLVVKTRKEIVTSSLGEKDVDPNIITGEYLSAEQLHQWYAKGKEFEVIDMRNDYEQAVGRFKNTTLSGMKHFKDLDQTAQQLSHLKDKIVLTVCTYGVRCEKASGYLKQQGYQKVYQLKDGIGTYMSKFPNTDFEGKLYVFDKRVVVGFETDSAQHKIIGVCEICKNSSENYVNCADNDCHKHFICCKDCHINDLAFCNYDCQLKYIQNENDRAKKVAV